MKQLQRTVLSLFTTLLIVGPGVYAAEEMRDMVIRNGLSCPIHFEISDNQFTHVAATSSMRPHWEMSMKGVKVDYRTATLGLGVKLREAEGAGLELARCQTLFPSSSENPKVAIIVYEGTESLRCDILDLNDVSDVSPTTQQFNSDIRHIALALR